MYNRKMQIEKNDELYNVIQRRILFLKSLYKDIPNEVDPHNAPDSVKEEYDLLRSLIGDLGNVIPDKYLALTENGYIVYSLTANTFKERYDEYLQLKEYNDGKVLKEKEEDFHPPEINFNEYLTKLDNAQTDEEVEQIRNILFYYLAYYAKLREVDELENIYNEHVIAKKEELSNKRHI